MGTETRVGSDPAADIPVRAEMGVLPWHFLIAPQNGQWTLTVSQGASVLVNGRPVQNIEIHDGDRIVAGQLELTYRDDQEKSATPNPFGSRTGAARQQDDDKDSPYASSPVAPVRPVYQNVTVITGGRRTPFWLMLAGLLLMAAGGYFGYQSWMLPEKRVRLEDLTIVEVLITGSTPHRDTKSLPWTELHTNLQTTRQIEMPLDLTYDSMWSDPTSIARIGFEKQNYEDNSVNSAGVPVRLHPVTLSVNGVSYRSLDKHNQVLAWRLRMLRTGCPVGALIGLIVFVHGREKEKSRRQRYE